MNPALRAASTDRERTVDVLKAAFAEGRLSQAEYNDRMARAYEAKTYGELSALTADLPAGPLPMPMQAPLQSAQYLPVPSSRTNSTAIAAMVLGIAEFATFGLTAIPAIICGHIAHREIRQTGEQGTGMATAGLVLGYLAVGFWSVMLIFLVMVARINTPGPYGG